MTKGLAIAVCCWCFNRKIKTQKGFYKKKRKPFNFLLCMFVQPRLFTPGTVHMFDSFTLLLFREKFVRGLESGGQLLMMYIFCDSSWSRGTSQTLTVCESNLKVSLVIVLGGSLRLVK